MQCRVPGLLLLLALGLGADETTAQQRAQRFVVAPPALESPTASIAFEDSAGRRSTLRLAAGGLLGGAIGGAALGAGAYWLACRGTESTPPESDFCGLIAFPGFLLGEMIGMPLGVHWANDAAGSVALDALASLASLIVGGGAMVLAAEAAPAIAPLVVAAQLAAIIMVERSTAEDTYYDDEPEQADEDPDFGYDE